MTVASRPAPSLNPVRVGRIRYSVDEYHAVYRKASASQRLRMLGHSPGAAAALAGISRQSIHRALDRGTLQAFYVYHDDGSLAWIIIPDDSLTDYIKRNRPRSRTV